MTKKERNKYMKNWYKNNPERLKDYRKKFSNYQKTYHKTWVKNNRDKVNVSKNKYRRKKLKNDSLYKLTSNIRTLICNNIKRQGYKKITKSTQILGCSFIEFKEYLENQFLPWMNWQNHGKYNGSEEYGWDLDHIIPISSAKTSEDIIRLNHYSNFRPLCSKINRDVKRNK
jgi:hypothetical protein